MPKESVDVVNMLLQAAFCRRQGASRRHAFVFGPPGMPSAFFNMGTEVFYSNVGLAKAALVLREGGALYLRSLPLGEIEGELTGFVAKAYWALLPHVWGQVFDGCFASRIPSAVQDELAKLLASSQLFSPAAVIHGGAPDVYDSSNYAKYFEDYEQDPVKDLERIGARLVPVSLLRGVRPGGEWESHNGTRRVRAVAPQVRC